MHQTWPKYKIKIDASNKLNNVVTSKCILENENLKFCKSGNEMF
jgi:hypothetical protein